MSSRSGASKVVLEERKQTVIDQTAYKLRNYSTNTNSKKILVPKGKKSMAVSKKSTTSPIIRKQKINKSFINTNNSNSTANINAQINFVPFIPQNDDNSESKH